jgi:hypothetical protein
MGVRTLAAVTWSEIAKRWAVLFIAWTALCALWVLASPPGSGPDEHAHAIKAAAAARGELVGRANPEIGGGSRIVRAPASLDLLKAIPACYAFLPTVPAGCSPSFTGSSALVEQQTRAGLAPPAYHIATGLPLRLWPSARGLYLARGIGAVINAALLASAFTLITLHRRHQFLLLGALVAWTPTSLYFTGVLNPSGLELSAAFLAWVAALCLARPAGLPDRGQAALPWCSAVSASALLLARQLGPLWLALIVASTAPLVTRTRAWTLWRWKALRLAAIPTAVAAATALLWLARYQPLQSDAHSVGLDVGLPRSIAVTFGRLGDVYTGAIGRFGWLDTPVPRAIEWLWTGVLFAVVSLGWALGSLRLRLALALAAIAAVAVPPLIEASQLETAGLVWQSRYTLPLAFGLPLLAGWAIDRNTEVAQLLDRWGRGCVVLLGAAQLVAFYVALRRYVVGTNGPVWFLGRGGWDPPAPAWALLATFVATLAVTGSYLQRVVPRTAERQADSGRGGMGGPGWGSPGRRQHTMGPC